MVIVSIHALFRHRQPVVAEMPKPSRHAPKCIIEPFRELPCNFVMRRA